jgi:large subunit ribosomal protein L37Ae
MYSHTKKVGSTGRFGPRIGRKVRQVIKKIEDRRRNQKRCPSCGKGSVSRKSRGIWACRSCGTTFAGGAHVQNPER